MEAVTEGRKVIMIYTTLSGSLSLDLPEGADVSDDGSVFGSDGLEFAVYVESPEETPRTDTEFRKEIIEGRSPVDAFTAEETHADGWTVLFESDGSLGFECGRVLDGRRFVFWADRLPDESVRTKALGAVKASRAS